MMQTQRVSDDTIEIITQAIHQFYLEELKSSRKEYQRKNREPLIDILRREYATRPKHRIF